MTKDEREFAKSRIEFLLTIGGSNGFDRHDKEALNLAITSLEQEPCEDAISRETVNALYDKWRPRLATHVSEFGDELKSLPSVEPSRRKGH